jgi:hypothetical protein
MRALSAAAGFAAGLAVEDWESAGDVASAAEARASSAARAATAQRCLRVNTGLLEKVPDR